MKHNINMKKKNFLKFLTFLIPFLTLITVSLFLMYHSQFISNIYSNNFEKQILWFSIGFLLLISFQFINTKCFFQFSKYLYLLSVILLIAVLFLGENINGATAWINLKYFSFQPSEFMKLTFALYLSQLCSKKNFYNWFEELKFLGYVFLLLIIPSVLVFLEPDTGAIIFYILITIASLWNSKISKKWFVIVTILFLSGITGFFYCYFYQKDFLISLIGTTFFYRVERLLSFRTGMQIENALISIGSAPLFQFKLTETGLYIPEAPTDFAFALTSNVFGITGCIIILICYLLIDFYLMNYVKKIKKKEYRYFGYSFLSIFIASQLINISMNLGIFPIIGIPLPFISYGGSSTIILFLFLAIIFSNKKIQKKKKKKNFF